MVPWFLQAEMYNNLGRFRMDHRKVDEVAYKNMYTYNPETQRFFTQNLGTEDTHTQTQRYRDVQIFLLT